MAQDAFGAGGDQYGYNHLEIAKIHDSVEKIGKATAQAIQDAMGTDIIQPMSTMWYAPEAVQFFKKFKDTVDGAAEQLTLAFNQFIDNVNRAQDAWAKKTATEGGQGIKTEVPEIGTLTITVDVSSIKPEDNGNIMLYLSKANGFAEDLSGVQARLDQKIAEQKEALENLNQAFLGGGQGAAVEHCFETVLGAIAKIFDFLTKGENSLQKQIVAAAETYTKMAEEITTGMNSATVGGSE